MNKTCIIIAGPTASGKTALAIEIAKHFSTKIISADSRQCFKELNIGVAKPTSEQLAELHHFFINSHSIHDNVNAADFEAYALQSMQQIFEKSDIALVAGGTGLYIRALCDGLDPIPAVSEEIRARIQNNFEVYGIDWLKKEVYKIDPAYYEKGEISNPQRLMRALEVILSTGRSITEYQTKIKVKRDFNIIKIGIELARQQLYERINARVNEMIEAGLIAEVRELLCFRHLNALQTVGYKELFRYLDGNVTFDTAVEEMKKNTRHYAKRQLTWFKREEGITWLKGDSNEVIPFIKRSL